MALPRLIEVRQPRRHDVIGRSFEIAGSGTGFQAVVKDSDTLTGIALQEGQNTTAPDIFKSTRDHITNPNLSYPGQVLRIPLLS